MSPPQVHPVAPATPRRCHKLENHTATHKPSLYVVPPPAPHIVAICFTPPPSLITSASSLHWPSCRPRRSAVSTHSCTGRILRCHVTQMCVHNDLRANIAIPSVLGLTLACIARSRPMMIPRRTHAINVGIAFSTVWESLWVARIDTRMHRDEPADEDHTADTCHHRWYDV
jgi:hypothetical protein